MQLRTRTKKSDGRRHAFGCWSLAVHGETVVRDKGGYTSNSMAELI